MVSAPGAAAGGTSMNVSVTVCPATMVPVAVLPEVELAPLTLCSVKPLGTVSVTDTVPAVTEMLGVQTGLVELAGMVMLGIVTPAVVLLKLKVVAVAVPA